MCFGQGCIRRAHNKSRRKLKEASKRINMKHKVGNLAMWLKIFKERMPLLFHQFCTCYGDFEQETRQVLEMQDGRIIHMKEMRLNVTNYSK